MLTKLIHFPFNSTLVVCGSLVFARKRLQESQRFSHDPYQKKAHFESVCEFCLLTSNFFPVEGDRLK